MEKYEYKFETREKIRKELDIKENEIALGHVGRFNDAKNHIFLVKMFKDLYEKDNRYKLVLCGDGNLKEDILNYCKENGIESNVLFLGVRSDINEVMQAMDIFVFPSKYEGLGIVLIEAQLTSMPSVVSDKIPKEAIYNSNVYKVGIEEENIDDWCTKIMEIKTTDSNRTIINEKLKNDYDIKSVTKKLCDIYEDKT